MTDNTEKHLNEEIARTQTYIAELQTAIRQQQVYLAKLMFGDSWSRLSEEANDNDQ